MPPWEPGSVRDLELQLGRDDSQAPSTDGLSSTAVTLTVQDRTDDGWIFNWESGQTSLDTVVLTGALKDGVSDLLADAPKQEFAYTLVEERLFAGLTNPDSVRQSAEATAEFLRDVVDDDEFVDDLVVLYRNMSDAQIEQIFAQAPHLLHLFEGLQVDFGEEWEVDDLLPNRLGGEPLPAITAIGVGEVPNDRGCVVIHSKTTLDSIIALPTILESVANAFDLDLDADVNEVARLAESVEMVNDLVVEYDHGTGFFVRIFETQRYSFDSQTRLDTRILTDRTSR